MVDAASDGRSRRRALLRRLREPALLAVTLAALLAGGIAWLSGARDVSDACWIAGTVVAIVPATWWVVDALRHRRVGVDLIAVLSLVGTLLVGEYLAGALIGVMLATGQALDAAAERRATKDLRSLLDHAPRTARRRVGDTVETVPLEAVVAGDALVVGPGEVVPVDGWVTSEVAVLDESVLTGEPLAVQRRRGEAIRSGTVDAGGAFEMQARTTADLSTYAGIVRLAQDAAAESAPVVRVADRIAGWFLPVALAVAGAAGYSAARRPARSPFSSSPHPAHCCWPRPSRSCRVCPAPRAAASWSVTAGRSRIWGMQPHW